MAVVETLTRALKDAGLQTEIHEFDVHLSTPRSISVQLTEPVQESLDVTEPASPERVLRRMSAALDKVGGN